MASLGTDGSGVVPPSDKELEYESTDKVIVRGQGTSMSLRVTQMNDKLWATCWTSDGFSLLDATQHWEEEDLEGAKEYVMAAAAERFGADCELTVEDGPKVPDGGSAGEGPVAPPSQDEIEDGEDMIIVRTQAPGPTLRVTKVKGLLWAVFRGGGNICYLVDSTKHWEEEDLDGAKRHVMAAAADQFGADCELVVADKTRASYEGPAAPPSEDEINDGDDKIIVRPQVPFTTLRVRRVNGYLWPLFQGPESCHLLGDTMRWGEEDLDEAKRYVLAAAAEKFGADHEVDVQVVDES
mmetsp:Transcript_39154/g.110686  ORF Transcript_39154/g.110686 Transcript_39154/m.110686 type:complete len:295 (+) Transcript_39154:153-1037(+)